MSYKPPFIEPGSRVPPGVFYQQQLLNLPHGPLSPPFVGQGVPAMSPHLSRGLSPPSVSALPELSYARYLAPGYYGPQLRHPVSEPVGYLPPHLAFDSSYLSDAAFPRNPYSLGDYRRTDHPLGSPARMAPNVPVVIAPDDVNPDLVKVRDIKKHPSGPPNLPSPPVLQRAPERSNISGPPPLTRAPEHIIPLSSPVAGPSQKTVSKTQASSSEPEIALEGPPSLKQQNNTEETSAKNVDATQNDHDDQPRNPSCLPVTTVPALTTDMSTKTKDSDTTRDSPLPIVLPSTSPALSDSSTSTSCVTPLAELSPSSTGLSKEEAQKKYSKLLESDLDMSEGVMWARPRDGRHECKLCNYVTSRLDKMEQHLIAHKGKLICDGCGKAFIKQCDLDRHKVARAKGRSRSCDIPSQVTTKQHHHHLQTQTEALEPKTTIGATGLKGTLLDLTGDDSGMSFSLVHVNPDDSSDDSTFAVISDRQQSACSNDNAQYTIGKAPSDAPSTTSLATVVNKAPLAAATNNPACSSHALHTTTAAASLLTCSVRNLNSDISNTDTTKSQSQSASSQEAHIQIEVSDGQSNTVLPSGERSTNQAPVPVTLESRPSAEKPGRIDKQQDSTGNEAHAPKLVVPSFERIVIVPDEDQSTSGPPSGEDTTWTERLTGILNKRAFPLIHSHSNSRVIEYARNRSHNQKLEPIVAPYFQMPVMGPVFPYPTIVQENPLTGGIGTGSFPHERNGSESERRESTRHDSLSVLRAQLERGVREPLKPDQSAADSGSKHLDFSNSKSPTVERSTPVASSTSSSSIENRPLHPMPEAEKEVNSLEEASTVILVHSDGQEDRMQIKKEPGLLDITTDNNKSVGGEEHKETQTQAQIPTPTSNIASSYISPGDKNSLTVHRKEDTMEDSLLEDPEGLNPMEPSPFSANNRFPASIASEDLDPALVKDFRCKLCNYTGRSLHCLIKHYKAHNIAHKICKYCDKAFERPSDLTRHVLRHHKSNIEGFTSPGKNREIDFNSDIATFTDYKKMKQMARVEENSDLFQCDRCKYSTTKMQELLLHRKRTHISWFFCEVCGAKFISQLALANHRHLTHELNDPLPNPVPYFEDTESASQKSASTSENAETKKPKMQGAPYSCPLCRTASDKFEVKSLLFRHIKNRHKDQQGFLRCDKCSFKTRKAQRLLLHLVAEKSHTRWSCDLCDSKFVVEDSLISHKLEVHGSAVSASNISEKSAPCQSHAGQLYQRTSQSDTIYSCSLCTFMRAEFRSKQALVGHLRTNHNDEDYHSCMSALDAAEITSSDPTVLRLDTYTSGILLKTSLFNARVEDDNFIALDFTEVTPQQMENLDVPLVSAVEDAKHIMHKITTDPLCSSPVSVILHGGCPENKDDSTSASSVEITSGRQKQDAESKEDVEKEDVEKEGIEKEDMENCSEYQMQDSQTATNVIVCSSALNSPTPSTKVAALPENPTLSSPSLASTVITLTPVRGAANKPSNHLRKMSSTTAPKVNKELSPALDSSVVTKSSVSLEVYRKVPSASNSTVFEQLPIPSSKTATKNQQGLYSCTKCSYSTNIEAKYDEHLLAHKGKFICKLCSKAFIKTSDLTRHWLTHGKMNGNKYLCDSCEYSTASRAALETHMKNHYCKMYRTRQVNKNVKCSSCGGKFLRREFWKHVKEVHGGMKGIRFKGKRHKRRHRASHTEAYRCQTTQISVDVSSTSSNVESFDISTKALPFPTNVNPTSVINISPNDYLSELVDDDDDGYDGTCKTASFEGNTDRKPTPSAKAKKRKHSHHEKDEKDASLMCIYCDKSFSSIERLENHLNLHERSYCSGGKRKKRVECPECHKIFCNAYYLADHMHLHTGEKPHVCEFCGKGFSIPQCLSSHKSQGKCPNMPGATPRDKRRLKKKKPTWYKPRVRRSRRSSAFALSTNCPPPPVDGTTLTHIIETETEEGVVVNEDTARAQPSSS